MGVKVLKLHLIAHDGENIKTRTERTRFSQIVHILFRQKERNLKFCLRILTIPLPNIFISQSVLQYRAL